MPIASGIELGCWPVSHPAPRLTYSLIVSTVICSRISLRAGHLLQ